MTTKQFEISQTFTIFTGESRHISSIILLHITLRKMAKLWYAYNAFSESIYDT